MRVLGVVVLPAAIVLVLAYAATHFVPGSSPTQHAQARGVVWAGRTFVDRTAFARWLRSRGSSYSLWARRHPDLSGVRVQRGPKQPERRAAAETGGGRRFGLVSAGLAGAAVLLALVGLALVLRRRGLLRSGGRRLRELSRGFGEPAAAARRAAAAAPAAAARRAAAAAARRARLLARRGAATVVFCATAARSVAFVDHYRRSELVWCLATAVLAVAMGLLVAAWLGGA